MRCPFGVSDDHVDRLLDVRSCRASAMRPARIDADRKRPADTKKVSHQFRLMTRP